MSDIFVSYANADRSRVKPLIDALQQEGWTVWWDRSIPPGKTWDEVIEAELRDAHCVLVLWSHASARSDWVRTEAEEAKRRGILVPVLLEDVEIPLAFRRIQAANLVDWRGTASSPGYHDLTNAVSAVLQRNAALRPKTPPAVRSTTQLPALVITGPIAVLCVAGLVFYFGRNRSPLPQTSQKQTEKQQTPHPESNQQSGKNGNLELYVEPGSEVFIDGRRAGIADASGRFFMADLVSGSHRVRVSHQGYENSDDTVTLTPGETVSLTVGSQLRVSAPARTSPYRPFTFVKALVGFRGGSGEVESVTITNDGKWVIAADNEAPSEVIIWETSTGRLLSSNHFGEAIKDAIAQIAVSPNAQWIVSTHASRYTGERSAVRVWEPHTNKQVQSIQLGTNSCGSASFSQDGKRLAVGTAAQKVTVFETARWTPVFTLAGGSCGTFSFNDEWIATGDARVKIWSARTGKLIRTMSPLTSHADSWGMPLFSADGQWIVAGTRGAGIQAWEVGTGRKAAHFGRSGVEERSVALSQNGGTVVTSDEIGTLVWDFASGQILQKLDLPSVAVSLGPDGEWLAVGTRVKNDLGIRLYHAAK